MALAVAPVKLPAALVGAPNGRLNPSLLTKVKLPGIADGDLYSTAARAWNCLAMVAAAETGQALTASGNPYRTYQQQVTLFTARYEPVSWATYLITSSSKRKTWPEAKALGYSSNYWKIKPGVAMAAVPGTSNHGLALAIDTALLVDGKIVPITSNGLFYAWLQAPGLVKGPWALGTGSNAESFGFSWEAQSEPWHIRLVTGDVPSQRVRDIEAFLGTTPT